MQVRTFEAHCGSLSQYGMKHMRSIANICNAGIEKEQMAEASAQACVTIPPGPWSSLDKGFSAWLKQNTETNQYPIHWICSVSGCELLYMENILYPYCTHPCCFYWLLHCKYSLKEKKHLHETWIVMKLSDQAVNNFTVLGMRL